MKRLLAILLLCTSAFATTTVTGNIKTLGTGNVTSGAFVRFWLRGCAGNQPRITGTGIIGPSQGGVFYFDLVANGSGAVSGTLFSTRDSLGTGNGDIECGGSYTAVWYGMQAFVAGKGGPEIPVHAKSGGTLDISNVTPITTNPVVTSPTGDSTYLRLDGGNSPLTGPITALQSNVLDAKTLNNIAFADQYPGTDASAKIQAAITALPTSGGVVDARNLSDVGGTGSATIDPGSKSVTVLLGSYTYNFSQIVVRTNLHVIGQGSGQGLSSSKPATLIQATGGNGTPPFVLGTTVGEGQEGIVLRGFRIAGTVGNTTQTAFSLVAGQSGGFWYSEMDDIVVSGFGGMGLDLEATNLTAPQALNQFDTFKRIIVNRTSGGNYALQIKGFNNSMKFENCAFDGPFQATDGGTNINIQDSAGSSFPPYNVKFDLLTSQWATVAMQINGADAVSVDQGHFEGDYGAFAVGTGASFGSLNITVHDSGFFNGTGIHGGGGYIMNIQGATANVSAAIIDSHAIATPDAFLTGNVGSVVTYGNVIGPEGSYVQQAFQPGGPNGFGAGASGTAVTTTTKGAGTGPTTPQTVVKYVQVTLSGVVYWIPLMQ